MKTNQLIITILILAILSLGLYAFAQPKKVEIYNNTQTQATSTVTTSTTTTVVVTPTQPTTPKPMPAKPVAQFSGTVSIAISDPILFEDGSVFSLKEISDSRCPTSVVCIWAGNVTATVNMKNGSMNEDFKVVYGGGGSSSFLYKGYTFTITAVNPSKLIDTQPTPQSSYRVTFSITK